MHAMRNAHLSRRQALATLGAGTAGAISFGASPATSNQLPSTGTKLIFPKNGASLHHESSTFSFTKPPYELSDFEPFFSTALMNRHYNFYYKNIINSLHAVRDKLRKFDTATHNPKLFFSLSRQHATHAAEYMAHSFFWRSIAPPIGATIKPEERTMRAVQNTFGSIKKLVETTASMVAGCDASGWLWICKKNDQDSLYFVRQHPGMAPSTLLDIPILAIDLSQHAYFGDYRNDTRAYVQSFFNIVHWSACEQQFYDGRNIG